MGRRSTTLLTTPLGALTPLVPAMLSGARAAARTWMTQRRGITSSLSASSSSRSQTTCRMVTHSVALRTQASALRSVKGASQPSEARTSRAHGRKCVKQAGVWWQDGAGQRLVRSRASLSSVDTARLRDGALGASVLFIGHLCSLSAVCALVVFPCVETPSGLPAYGNPYPV